MYSIHKILQHIIGYSYKLEKDILFSSTAPIEEISVGAFLFRLRTLEYLDVLLSHPYNVAGVVCPSSIAQEVSKHFCLLETNEGERLFWEIHNSLDDFPQLPSTIGNDCMISDHAIISKYDVKIGNNVVIEENVIIRRGVEIRDECIIRAGCVLGGEGFQHYKDSKGTLSVKHHGKVSIYNNVEIQYNSCIDKALYPYMVTIIGAHSRLDNLVQVGHAAHLGEKVFAASGVVFGGYVEIGDDTFVGMNAAIRQHVKIGKNCLVGMNSAVIKDFGPNCTLAGFPARIICQKE
jgi:acetyltransferase-like isoleucine patch superfamily enzyme